jgi:murein DD-endopeptidase MepM/ murein hydrolase activator NlpD
MKATNFIRALVSAGFGALAYVAFTMNGSSQASSVLETTVETKKITVVASAPRAAERVKKVETFVAATKRPTPTPTLRNPRPIVITGESTVAKHTEVHKQQTEQIDQAKINQAKQQAEKRAKEKAALIKKVTELFVSKKEREERERKKKEEAEAKREREARKGVPVNGGVIAATFGATGSWARYHTGIDYSGVPYGSAVRAVASGRIIYAGNKGNWAGNHVVIKHSDGKKTLYAHLSSISKRGGRVDTGDKIGRVGSSGRAFGTHLHLELYPEGAQPGDVYSAINPRPWLREKGIR